MPGIRLPPDKLITSTRRVSLPNLKLTDLPSSLQIGSNTTDNTIDIEKPHTSLAKPCSISSKAGSDNLKNIIKGKYLTFSPQVITSSSEKTPHGPYCDTKSHRKKTKLEKGDKIAATKLSPVKNILPPKPPIVPVLRPQSHDAESVHDNLPNVISKLLHSRSRLHQPLFKFEASQEAASHNWTLLKDNNFNLEKLLNPANHCITNYGSEFKPTNELDPLLSHHPRWIELKDRLDNGVTFPLSPLDEASRKQDLMHAYIRGNHKSAKKEETHLADAMEKEISKGWNIILPDSRYTDIPNLILNPMGVASHCGISAFGEFIDKLRITHDLSFPGKISNESVNSRSIPDDLEPCMFGHALLRIIHYIVNLRKRHPQKKIWVRKEDIKSAYRRMHLSSESAFTSAVRIKIKEIWYILLSIRLPFGGATCPSEFCLLSDMLADLINDLLTCKTWDHTIVKSDYTTKIPPAVDLDPSIPFAQARELIVDLPIEDEGKTDVFIDDLISVAVDINNNLDRIRTAPCTVLHAIAHSSSHPTHLKRDNLIADDKNDAEGAPEERKICLGWLLDTRKLTVSLPTHKYKAWSTQITDMLDQKTVSEKLLASVLGRLENVATIIVMMGHFLSNIRGLQIQANHRQHNVRLSKQTRDDLNLCLKFYQSAHEGVSMNLLTFRQPDTTHIGDASEHGLGAFASHGRAWRYIIPVHLRGRAHINLLEFLTQVVSIWIDIIEGKTNPEDCILCMGDSTSAMGWLRRSNFRLKEENDFEWKVKQNIARKLASLVLESKTMLYRQWFAGELNVVADSLSRDAYYLSQQSHTSFLHSVASPQLPQNFHISPVPTEICYFISSMLEQLPVKELRLLPQKPSETALGNAGILLSLESEHLPSCILTHYQHSRKTSSCPPSHKPSENVLSHKDITNIWLKEQSAPPLHMWHRPSGQTTGRTQDWTATVKLASYCKNNTEGTKTKMGKHGNKKRYR